MRVRVRWIIVAVTCVGIAAGSLAVQNAADFDPWGWIVWGREVMHLDLSTVEGPSWKPGAVLFTTVYSLFGGAAPSLWLVTVRIGALLGVVMAYRIGARLAGRFAGVIGALLLLVTHHYILGALYGEAEPLMVGFLLFAVERILAQSLRAALVLLLLASLLRPEVWPLFLAYCLYLWLRTPVSKTSITTALLLLPLLWFGGDWWGSGDPFLSGARAKQFTRFHPSDQFAQPGLEMFKLFNNLTHRPVILIALVAVVMALVRRHNLAPLLLAAGAVTMLVVVAAMAQDGYPVLDRFLLGSVALTYILAGVGAAQLVRFVSHKHTVAGAAVAALLVGILMPLAVSNAKRLRGDVRGTERWSHEVNSLPAAVSAAGGGKRLVACDARIASYLLLLPALSWDLGAPMTRVLSRDPRPAVVVFIHPGDRLRSVESSKPQRINQIAQTRDWRVLYVVNREPAPSGC